MRNLSLIVGDQLTLANPTLRRGETACPIAILYWDVPDQQEKMPAAKPHTALMAENLHRLPDAGRLAIRRDAKPVLEQVDTL